MLLGGVNHRDQGVGGNGGGDGSGDGGGDGVGDGVSLVG